MSRTYRVKGFAWFKQTHHNDSNIVARLSRYDVRLEDAFEPVVVKYTWYGENHTRVINHYWTDFRIGSKRLVANNPEEWMDYTIAGSEYIKAKYQRDRRSNQRHRGNRFMKEHSRNTERAELRNVLHHLSKDPDADVTTTHRKYIRGIIRWLWD